jgi:hypothetical protein
MHLDGMMFEPTLLLDGEAIIKDGVVSAALTRA